MRTLISVVVLALVVALGSQARADDAAPLKGKVTAITKDSSNDKVMDITVTPHAKKGETATAVVVKADDSTKVTTVAGKGKDPVAASLTDIVVGSAVTVTLGAEGKPAVAIEVHAGHAKKPVAVSK